MKKGFFRSVHGKRIRLVYEARSEREAKLKNKGWLAINPDKETVINWVIAQRQDIEYKIEEQVIQVETRTVFIGNWILFENIEDALLYKLTWG